MTDDPTTTLAAHADVTDQHAAYLQCRCGVVFAPGGWAQARTAHAEHQLAVLAEEGWAVVKLPEEEEADCELYGRMWEMQSDRDDERGPRAPRIILDDKGGEVALAAIPVHHMRIDMAVWLAASLLAAARAAEEVVL